MARLDHLRIYDLTIEQEVAISQAEALWDLADAVRRAFPVGSDLAIGAPLIQVADAVMQVAAAQ